MRREFNFMTPAAQDTQVNAMVNWGHAPSVADAIAMISANPTNDFAGIANSVYAGLEMASKLLLCPLSDLLTESNLSHLAKLSADQNVLVMDAIHTAWVIEHFTVDYLIDKHSRGQHHQYRKTAKIGRNEVQSDLLFFNSYLERAGSTLTEEEILMAYDEYAARADDRDLHLEHLKNIARTHFVGNIYRAAMDYINTNSKSSNPVKRDRAKTAGQLVQQCQGNPALMLDTILNAI